MFGRICAPAVLSLTLATLCLAPTTIADEQLQRPGRQSRPITKPKFDPSAKKVNLFDGIADSTLQTKVIANSPHHGHVLITNATSEPLTVQLPDSFVAVQVLKQFGFGNQQNQNAGANGFGQNNQQQNGGQQQSIGGGMQNPGGGPNNGNVPGGGPNGSPGGGPMGIGFFSVPPEKTVKVSFTSACLEHGKADPTPRANYQLVATDVYTQDIVLQELIRMTGLAQSSRKAIQAAVWHQANRMTWQQLSAKYVYGVTGKSAYFTTNELQAAKQIVQTATDAAVSRKSERFTRALALKPR